jgi:hypothetical protein
MIKTVVGWQTPNHNCFLFMIAEKKKWEWTIGKIQKHSLDTLRYIKVKFICLVRKGTKERKQKKRRIFAYETEKNPLHLQ